LVRLQNLGLVQSAWAIDVIHEFTQGISRKINNLCCASLLSGFGERKSLIDDYLVRQVIGSEFASWDWGARFLALSGQKAWRNCGQRTWL